MPALIVVTPLLLARGVLVFMRDVPIPKVADREFVRRKTSQVVHISAGISCKDNFVSRTTSAAIPLVSMVCRNELHMLRSWP